jgi:hypothetical protein
MKNLKLDVLDESDIALLKEYKAGASGQILGCLAV